MPPARTITQYTQTAAATQDEGSGCLSGFMLPPLLVIIISVALGSLAWRANPLANSPLIPDPLPTAQEYTTPTPFLPSTNTPVPSAITETALIPIADTPTITVVQAQIVTEAATSDSQVDISNIPLLNSLANFLQPAQLPSSSISPVFTTEIQHWGTDIVRWAADSQVDPNLAATVMQIESCGDPRATSSAGAIGLFQVMPFHFYITDSPYNSDTNAARGLAYLARSLAAANGDARLALAGYNGGIGVIDRGEWTWPAETKRYVQYGWPIYQDARSGASTSNAVDEWYSKYGASMCRHAHERLGLP